jgi:DNA-binding CsgD family transcriptional regulator
VVLVEGEAGIGKSRLLRELVASPAGLAHKTLIAECPPFRQPHTLGPLIDAVRQATDGVAGFRLSRLAGALRPLFPEWAADLPPAPEPAEDATAARHRVFRALAELLGGLRVTVLAVEDAHWADEATLEFLLFLTSRQPQLSLVVTYRPEDVPAGSLLFRLSSRPPAASRVLRLSLGLLDVAGTAGLVSSMLDGEHVTAEFAGFLHQRTEGLPLAVEESVRLMHDRADLAFGGRGWVRRSLAQITVPPTVRDAVLERASRLPPGTQAVLRAAAVLAGPVTETTLATVAVLAPDRARAALTTALACGLLAEAHPGLIAFRHMLAAQAVHESIPAPERRDMHLRAAHTLEHQSPVPAGQLARHYREAGDTAQWCRYGERAADEALAAGDEATAIVLLHDLLTRASPAPGSIARLAKKIPLTITGHARCQEVAHALRSALDAGIPDAAEGAGIRAALGRALIAMDEYEEGRVQLEQAIPHLRTQPAEAAGSMIILGWPRATAWPASVHLHWLQRAAQMEAPTEPADRLLLIVDRATALLALGEEGGWAVAAGIPPTSSSAPERLQIARGHANIGDAAAKWGRYKEARRRVTQALELADRYGYKRLHDHILVTQSHVDWFVGAWDGLAERAADLAANEDIAPVVRLEAAMVTGFLHAARGEQMQAQRALQTALEDAQQHKAMEYFMELAAVLGELHLAEGRIQEALDVTREPAMIVQRKEIWIWATELGPARVSALLAAGRRNEAAQFVTAFARGLRDRQAPAPRAALILCRAILTEGKGEHAHAAALYSRAATAWQALPRPYDALLARRRQADCVLATGHTDAAVSLLTEVLEGMTSLGAKAHADNVARQLREHGVEVRPVPRRGRRGYGNQLSPRELDVVSLVANGKTNKEIARILSRSPTTVATQLSSAMRKFRVTSRTALALRATEAGLIPGPPGTPGQ